MEQNQNNRDSDPMEQQLEAYAQNRRKELENEPIALDEATRTMLQGEVNRAYPEKPAQRPATVETGMPAWLPWAMGGAVCALALVASLDFNSASKATNPMELAQADPKSPNPIPAAEESTESVGKLGLEDRDISTESAAIPSRVLTRRSVDKESADATALNEPKKVSPPQPMPAPRRVVALKAAPKAFKVPLRRAAHYNNLADMAQDFVQEPAGESVLKTKQLPEPILVDFQIERKGNLVTVMDRDGSVYTGNVINEEKFSAPAAVKSRLSAAASAPSQRGRAPERAGAAAAGLVPATIASGGRATPVPKPVRAVREEAMAVHPVEGQFFFRVQGTNQTLQRLVVFEATLDGMPHQANNWQYKRALRQPKLSSQVELKNKIKSTEEIKELSKKAEMQRVQSVQLLRVQGNARIGKANYRLDAFQTPSGSYRPSVNSKADTPTPRK